MNGEKIFMALELSAAAYRDVQPIMPECSLSVIDSSAGVQCFVRRCADTLTITFRGTDSSRDWLTNLRFWKKTVPYGNRLSPIRVHSGFIRAYKATDVRGAILSNIVDDINKIRICGHSYGAALSVLCAVDIEYNFPNRDIEVALFGCPRVGNRAFAESYNRRVFKTIRVENGNDMVTKLPPLVLGYRHVGARLCLRKSRPLCGMMKNGHSLQLYFESMLNERGIFC